jgi:hypothetical protein
MTVSRGLACAAQSDFVQKRHIVFDHGRFPITIDVA